MERQAVKKEIVPFALARAHSHAHGAEPEGQLVCCALLGAAAQKLTRDDIEKGFLHRIVTLCQVPPLLSGHCMLSTPTHLGDKTVSRRYSMLASQI